MNVSATGMVLVAALEGPPPAVGALLQTEFVLPQTEVRIHCEARVAWSDLVRQQGANRVSLGLAFETMPATSRAFLAEHVAAYRPHVVIAFATLEQAWSEELGNDVVFQEVASLEELRDVLTRGDISAVIVFGDDEARAIEAVEAVGQAASSRRWGLQYRPGVIFCAEAKAEALLRLHNEGKIFASLSRPIDLEALSLAVQQAAQDHAVRSELRRATHELERAVQREAPPVSAPAPNDIGGLVFKSDAMRKVVAHVQIVARHRTPVLVAGETGTGKELLARAIHGLSARANAPFVVQDCGVLSESLLDSELFGHVKGAFTGAVSAHPGLFGVADGGTIFLDEIENTTPGLQAKLLRVIESGEMRSVGSARSRVVDVRVVAASNMNLLAEVEAGRFRADLYYRLTAFPIEVPPLRARRDDIMPLAEVMLQRAVVTLGRRVEGFTREAEEVLIAQEWKGNVRELRNIVERAVLLLGDSDRIGPEQLPDWMTSRTTKQREADSRSLQDQIDDFEREVVRKALERNGMVLRRAAMDLKTNAMTFARRATRLGLWPPPPPAEELTEPTKLPRAASQRQKPGAELPDRRQKSS